MLSLIQARIAWLICGVIRAAGTRGGRSTGMRLARVGAGPDGFWVVRTRS